MNNFCLPTDTLSFRGDSFYSMIEEFCGKLVVDLLRFQLIDSSMSLLDINDPFVILQVESDRTILVKESLEISCTDEHDKYFFFVMPGIRLKLEELIRSLRNIDASINQSSVVLESLTISSKLVEKYPFLLDLMNCLESSLLTDFSINFLSNWISNMARLSKNSFRYSQSYDNNDTDNDDSLTDSDASASYIIRNVSSCTIQGVRIFYSIDEDHSESFFCVKINNKDKFMHKQSATWYLSKDKIKLSADRLKRIQSRK